VDEWGGWYAPLPGSDPGFLVQQNGMRDAVLAALNLNIFARHTDRVRMANIAQMINVLQAMIMTDKEKMVLTPTYYVYKMYVPFQDATLIPVAFDAGSYKHGDIALPRADAIAAKDLAGKLWLEVTNLRQYRAIAIDVGNQDGLRIDAGKLHDVLEKYGVAKSFEVYPGTQIRWPIVSRIM
jgi:alpha-N-arabinofuranosidase